MEKKPEKFIKRIIKWGLLRRVAISGKYWSFVNLASRLYDTEIEACQGAIELNAGKITHRHILYIYKPVKVLLQVQVDKWISK